MYRVLEYFTDLKDNGYEYKAGDTYPREGYEPSAERIEELSTDKNVRKRPVIELITASKTVVIEEATVSSTETTEEKPKKRGKKREE
jgi:hypothetical protein